MENPSAEQAIQIISELVTKTLNTQSAFDRAIKKLVEEAVRIRDSVEDSSKPLPKKELSLILQNVAYIIRELGMVENGFGRHTAEAPHQQMTYELEVGAVKQ